MRPTQLVDGQQTLLPANWDEVIIQGAVWRGFKATGDLARAELAKVDFDALINNQYDIDKVRVEDQTEGMVHVESDAYDEALS